MTRFAKIYQEYKSQKVNTLNREGYGYIKRRVGLLSNELKAPTYCSIIDKSESISPTITKS